MAYVDGALAPDEAAQVRAHLDGCPECRAAVTMDLRIARAIRALPAWEAPPAVTAMVLARTRSAPAGAHQRLARWLPTLRIAVPGALVMSLLAVLGLSGLLPLALAFTSRTALGAMGNVAGTVSAMRDALEPLTKVFEAVHPGRILGTAFRAVVEAPPVEFGVLAILAMLLFVLVGLRRHAARTPGGVNHAAIL